MEVFQTNEKRVLSKLRPRHPAEKAGIEDWQKQRDKLMGDPEIRSDWLTYRQPFSTPVGLFQKISAVCQSNFNVDGKAVGNKPNLYNLFTEQCFNLLRPAGNAAS